MKKCLFLTMLLPIMLLLIMMLPVQAIAAQPLKDGQYRIEVTLSGGSGRAKVESPAKLTVADGAATAVVIWSSPYYEYMVVDGIYYYPVNTKGNSMFEIPVSLDEDMEVSAQTVAMSEPHEIDYTLRFDSAAVKPLAGDGAALTPPGIAAMAAAALIVLTAAGLLIAASKRRAKGRKAAEEK
jgi:hypothetical protein